MTLANLLHLSDENENIHRHNDFDASLGELSLDGEKIIPVVETTSETTNDVGTSNSSTENDTANEIKKEITDEELSEKENTDDGIFKEDSTVALADDDTLKTLTTESLIEKRRALLFLSNGQNATTRESFSFFSEELDKLEEELASRGIKLP